MSRWLLRRETSLGNLFQCSIALTVKKYFLMFRGNLLCFSLCPLPLVLSLGTTDKSLAPSSLQVFTYIDDIPLSLLFSSLNKRDVF